MQSEYLPLIAILGVTFGPIVQLIIGWRQNKVHLSVARLQFRKDVLSRNRQEWIHMLRKELAQLLASVGTYSVIRRSPEASPNQYLECWRDLSLHGEFVALMLSNTDDNHKELEIAIGDMLRAVANEEERMTADKVYEHVYRVRDISRKIFREVWAQVKQGD